MTIYTIGHSTRDHADLFTMLRNNGVTLLSDIRSYPSSRFCPQWNQQAIADAMPADIGYIHLPALGGKRTPLPIHESRNPGWRNAAFRGYADYMQTAAFNAALSQLLELAVTQTVAIMCAEVLPWRCHRSLVSDALIVCGVEVCNIMSMTVTKLAAIHAFAQVQDGNVSYPAAILSVDPAEK